MTEAFSVRVEAAPTFGRNIRKLKKKYHSIREDVQPIVEKLQQGEILGAKIPDIGYSVFKVRVRNRDNQKGKSGGYRLIYYLQTAESIILLTIYSKSEQANISADDIKQIIGQQTDTK
ncbi:MAG: type II toxin-antitoxin system RelE/ParE family toxin [Cyanobacteria bacterium P01_F01_bin.150]